MVKLTSRFFEIRTVAEIQASQPGRMAWYSCLIALIFSSLFLISQNSTGAEHSKKEQNRAAADAFFTNFNLTRISLEISEEALESLRKTPREYVRITLREGDLVLSNVAAHLKGGVGSFRKVDDRPGFTLDFNRFAPEGRFHGLKKLHLNNGVQDPSRLSEWFGSQLLREAGVPAARAAHALVELNGRKLGLYVAVEGLDGSFLARYFKNNNGNLYGQTKACDVTDQIERMDGDEPLDYSDLKALAAAVQEPDASKRLTEIEKTLDVERFLSFMAMEVLLTHTDGYTFNRHNYRIYHDPDTGRMTFLPHDMDQLMKRPALGFLAPARGLVAQAVQNTPELKQRYLSRISYLATNLFIVPRLAARLDQAAAALGPAVAEYDAPTAAAFSNGVAELKARLFNRGALIQRQLDIISGRITPLAFYRDNAKLKDWRPDAAPAGVKLERVKIEGGQTALAIILPTSTNAMMNAAAWRATVLLAPGRYRFEGLARCEGVVSVSKRRVPGAGLAVPAFRLADSRRLTGDSPWQKLSVEFELTTQDDVELACELRSESGQAWFVEESLQLTRLPPAIAGISPTTLEKAVAGIKAASEKAAQDATRPIFHFRPQACSMGEICGVVPYQGIYHLFFAYNPWPDGADSGAGWGHARSRDLARWENLQPALLPDTANGSTFDGPGSVVLDEFGKPLLFYAHTPAGFPKNKRQPWMAFSDDLTLLRWRRVELGLAPGQNGVPRGVPADWGGMNIFKAGDKFFATLSKTKGLVAQAENSSLTQWKIAGQLPKFAGDSGRLYPVADRFVLISPGFPVAYLVGDFNPKKAEFSFAAKSWEYLEPAPRSKGAVETNGLAGATIFTDAKNRTILVGHVQGFKPSGPWNGVMSLPRILKLENGRLLQEPLPEIAQWRSRRLYMKPGRLESRTSLMPGYLSDALEAIIEIKPGTASSFGLRLRSPATNAQAIVIRQTANQLNVAGVEIPHQLPAGADFKLHLFFDKSLLEIFADDGRLVLTRVVASPAQALQIEVFAEGGDITIQRVESWTIRPLIL